MFAYLRVKKDDDTMWSDIDHSFSLLSSSSHAETAKMYLSCIFVVAYPLKSYFNN